MIDKLDGFDLRDRAAPDLGLGAAGTSGATVARPRIGFDFRSAIEPVIVTNFEQIAAMVERLTPKEVSGAARLEVAKLYLQKTKDPARHRKGQLAAFTSGHRRLALDFSHPRNRSSLRR